MARCVATGDSVAATPLCTATPCKMQLEVRHPFENLKIWVLQGPLRGVDRVARFSCDTPRNPEIVMRQSATRQDYCSGCREETKLLKGRSHGAVLASVPSFRFVGSRKIKNHSFLLPGQHRRESLFGGNFGAGLGASAKPPFANHQRHKMSSNVIKCDTSRQFITKFRPSPPASHFGSLRLEFSSDGSRLQFRFVGNAVTCCNRPRPTQAQIY